VRQTPPLHLIFENTVIALRHRTVRRPRKRGTPNSNSCVLPPALRFEFLLSA
jgi:hypothetical protein